MQTLVSYLYMSFFRPSGRKNDIHEKGKYHAAAGYNSFCVCPKKHKVSSRKPMRFGVGGVEANFVEPWPKLIWDDVLR
jgi:hypothetical protein